MSDERRPRQEAPGEFFRTLRKVLLSLVLGFAALIALGATVCGFVLGSGMHLGGLSVAAVGAIVLGLLVYAISQIWR